MYNLRLTKDVFRISCARSSVEETSVEMLGRKGKQFDPTSSERNVNRLACRLLHEATPAVSRFVLQPEVFRHVIYFLKFKL